MIEPTRARDLKRAALVASTLAGLMYGFSRLPSIFGAGLVAAGLALLGAFILWEKRVPAPVLDVRLFRANRVFAFSNAAALVKDSATSAVSFLLLLA
jgi:hypothetical protein